MKSLKLILFLLLLTSAPMLARDVVWYNGRGHVGYEFFGKHSPIVQKALALFADDMEQVTGHRASHKSGATIQIFQLNKMRDKDFRKLQKRHVPLDKIIAKRDAFYVGCEGGKVVVCGSNDYGTAYGILELSRLAGVSPWVWWEDAKPLRRHYLALKSTFYTLQWPSVEKRGFVVSDPHVDRERATELLLRLRGNTLRRQLSEAQGGKSLKLREQWLPSTQPGAIYSEMREAYDRGATREWTAEVSNPKVVSHQLQLFMDMAWNIDYVKASTVQDHYRLWLAQQFGDLTADKLLPIMTEYYHLVGIRRPEELDVEIAADAFGNELERYIDNFHDLCKDLEKIEPTLLKEQQDAYFALVKYPITAAWLMAEKQLQAQEARHIGRSDSFHHDEEALASAVRSWNAHQQLLRLNRQYTQMADGKWKDVLDPVAYNKLVSAEPTFPGKLTQKEIEQYSKQEEVFYNFDTDNTITRNACQYRRKTAGVEPVEMLGHSMKAMRLPAGGRLSYSFYSELSGEAVIRVAAIPTQGFRQKDVRFQVKMDDEQPVVFSVKSPNDPKQWLTDSKRGQAVRSLKVNLTRNSHNIVIEALDDGVCIDQLMVDYDPVRIFYIFPVNSALQ